MFDSPVLDKHFSILAAATLRVNWVYFLETWFKILVNNLTRLKVGYDKIMG